MKKRHGIWIGVLAAIMYQIGGDLGYIVVALPLAIYIVLKTIDTYREENSNFLYMEMEDAKWICTLPDLKTPGPSWYQR